MNDRAVEELLQSAHKAAKPTDAQRSAVQQGLLSALQGSTPPPQTSWSTQHLSRVGQWVGIGLIAGLTGFSLGRGQSAPPLPLPDEVVTLQGNLSMVEAEPLTPSLPIAPLSIDKRLLQKKKAQSTPTSPRSSASTWYKRKVAKPTGRSVVSLRRALELLRRAEASLRKKRPLQALTALEQLQRIAPAKLVEERKVTQVLARCQLGELAKAEQLARELFEINPDTIYVERLEGSCAGNLGAPKTLLLEMRKRVRNP